MEQRSPEWVAARLGKVTASRVADLMAKTKSGPSASRQNYMADLIVERLTGEQADHFQSAAMIWGTETEPLAREAYSFITAQAVVEEGFVLHPSIADFGASPDGLVGSDGLVEIKCPATATHIETLLTETVPAKYITQMQAQMACTGRAWCDFVSFDPRMPGDMQLWVKRVPCDPAFMAALEGEVQAFLAELAQKLDALTERYAVAA
ncbi:MAG: YqaJ viral recombinase family protein [Alphaproteobacteria bacterium]